MEYISRPQLANERAFTFKESDQRHCQFSRQRLQAARVDDFSYRVSRIRMSIVPTLVYDHRSLVYRQPLDLLYLVIYILFSYVDIYF